MGPDASQAPNVCSYEAYRCLWRLTAVPGPDLSSGDPEVKNKAHVPASCLLELIF